MKNKIQTFYLKCLYFKIETISLLNKYLKKQFKTTKKMDIKAIKEQLPTGAIKEIANISGVHYATVQNFFNGSKTKEDVKLIETTADYLKKYKEKKKLATDKLQAVASA